MIKLIVGIKGTGKTKTLIQMVNANLETTTGDVVVLEKGDKLRFDVKHEARLINTDEYGITDSQSLYGFIAGILASNHDVTDLYIDAVLKICNNDVAAVDRAIEELDILTVKKEINVVMTVSIADEDVTDVMKKYI